MKSLEELKSIAFKDGLSVSSDFLRLVQLDAYLAGLRKLEELLDKNLIGTRGICQIIDIEITRAEKEGV